MIWNVQKETGWTDDYILWEIPWVVIRMKLADAPYYSYSKSKNVKDIENEQELEDFLSGIE